MRVRLIQSLFVLSTLTLASAASAHFQLKKPAPSNATDDTGGKGGVPCGPDAASAVITPIMGGTMLDIEIDETVYHPGHYRISLALNSRAEISPPMLLEPVVKGGQGQVLTPLVGPGNSASADIMNPAVFPVLADGLFPHTSDMGTHTGQVAIPNVNCDKCTLQVIEFMAEHGPDYFYRHCADLKITADPAKPVFNPNGMGGGGAGGGGAGGASGGGGGVAGAAGGAGGAGGTGTLPMGGVAGTAVGGASAGTVATGGTGTAGTAPITNGAAADDGSCSVTRVTGETGSLAALAAGLLVGLGWLSRRQKRAR